MLGRLEPWRTKFGNLVWVWDLPLDWPPGEFELQRIFLDSRRRDSKIDPNLGLSIYGESG